MYPMGLSYLERYALKGIFREEFIKKFVMKKCYEIYKIMQ